MWRVRFTDDPRRCEPAALRLSRERSSTRQAEPGSRPCSLAPISFASLGFHCGLSSGLQQIPACSNIRFRRPRPELRFPPGSASQPLGFSTRANGTGKSCVVWCATDRLPARSSWTQSSPRSRSNMAPRSAQRIATSRGFPGSGGRTLSWRTVDLRHERPRYDCRRNSRRSLSRICCVVS
jgi:hypothetical protein